MLTDWYSPAESSRDKISPFWWNQVRWNQSCWNSYLKYFYQARRWWCGLDVGDLCQQWCSDLMRDCCLGSSQWSMQNCSPAVQDTLTWRLTLCVRPELLAADIQLKWLMACHRWLSSPETDCLLSSCVLRCCLNLKLAIYTSFSWSLWIVLRHCLPLQLCAVHCGARLAMPSSLLLSLCPDRYD